MKYIFSEDQFDVILALSGANPRYLFTREGKITDEAIIRTTARLYTEKKLTEISGKLIPIQELQDMFCRMEQSKYVVFLQLFERNIPNQLIYKADSKSVIVLEKFQEESAVCLKLQKIQNGKYVSDLFENDVLPETLMKGRREAENLERKNLVEIPEEYEEQDVIVRIRRIQTEDALTDHVTEVIQTPVFRWIHGYVGFDSYYHIYSKEEMSELLLKEIKGVEL